MAQQVPEHAAVADAFDVFGRIDKGETVKFL
jgi:hypothetical protein